MHAGERLVPSPDFLMSPTTDIILGNEQRMLGLMLGGFTGDNVIDQEGDWIGPYQLIQRLGEGGFGVVWKARQTHPVEREVALKVIKRGMDTVQVLSRFTQERQALAGMDHPCIAAMLDAGASADGRPYFAMELVKGEPITQWCESRRLPIHERLRLFVQVCHAVQHAHHKGIIHRDLKPSNILITSVDDLPTPKIIDFGIAKAIRKNTLTELTLLTHSDQMLGTPLYMSPEQLEGGEGIDTRSDIYALGVLLYELLTGTPPFSQVALKAEGIHGIKSRIREERPERPSTLIRKRQRLVGERPPLSPPFETSQPDFSCDLDWITMRALEKEAQRRYPSAAEFAADIKRFLVSEPVLAHPPSFGYVAGRWIKRNQKAALAACLILLTMISGTAVALWQASLARQAQVGAEQAVQALRRAEVESARARQNTAFLTALLDRVIEEVHRGRNPEAFRFALADSVERIGTLTEDHELRLHLLERVATIYENIGETKLMLPLFQKRAVEMAAVHGIGSPEAFAAELEHIKKVIEHGARRTAPGLLEDLKRRMEAKGARGNKLWFEMQRVLIRSWVKVKDAVPARAAADECLAEARVQGYRNRSLLTIQIACLPPLGLAGDYDRAESLWKDCVATAKELKDDVRLKELDSHFIHLMWSKGDHARAAEYLRGIVSQLKAAKGEQSPEILPRLMELVAFERDAKQFTRAIADGQEAIRIAGSQPDLRSDLIHAMVALSQCFSAAGQAPEAIKQGDDALALALESGKESMLLKTLDNLAYCHRKAGNLDEAVAYLEQRLTLVESAHANYQDAIEDMKEIATIRITQGRIDEAMKRGFALWDRLESEPAASMDPAYRKEAADMLLKGYEIWRKAHANDPEPAPLAAWKAAAADDSKPQALKQSDLPRSASPMP